MADKPPIIVAIQDNKIAMFYGGKSIPAVEALLAKIKGEVKDKHFEYEQGGLCDPNFVMDKVMTRIREECEKIFRD